VTPPDSDAANSSKRKREVEPERKKKNKNRKTDKVVVEEPTNDSPNAPAFEIPSTLNQPTPPKQKKARKQKNNAQSPTTPIARPVADIPLAEESDEKPAIGARSAPGTPKHDGSLTPGGRSKVPRGFRTREKDSLKIGFYTPEEVEKIETFKINFCTSHNLPSTTFDEMVQHSERGGNGDFPVSTEVTTKGDFWNEIYGLVPDRDRRSVYRFMRRHFQVSAQRAHDWSREQEEELISLVGQHGPKWTYIGRLIGRSDDDVTQRWKNKLEHQGTMNQGAWDEDETLTFLDAMEASWVNMKPLLAEKAGKDLYDLDEKLVAWGNVSQAMGYRRSRQQCADKWRKIVKQVKTLRANGMPDAVFDVKAAVKNVANRNGRFNRKSAAFVDEEDEDNEDPETTKRDPENNPELAKVLSNLGQARNQAEPEPELPDPEPESTKKSKKSKFKRKREGAAVQLDKEPQAEVGEPELPPTSNKSRLQHTQNTVSDAVEEPTSSLATKKTKAERKREKKERKEQQEREHQEQEEREHQEQEEREHQEQEEREQEQEIAEAKARKDAKAARKEAKRLRKEEARLAAEAESPEPNKNTSNKPRQVETGESSRSASSELPAALDSTAAESDQDGSDSDVVNESDVSMKYEYDSDEQ
jgi:hypothetical protein